ncbi:MAG: hypothetical protein IT179_13400 [Acidobacteria bacterium]|nr:hypothetical protein [Acidobacteriota bacterium]
MATARTSYSRFSMDGIVTVKRNDARSPARVKAKGASAGSAVQPGGTRSARTPLLPASRLFSTSTAMSTRLVAAARGTTAVAGDTVSDTAGTTRSSRIT